MQEKLTFRVTTLTTLVFSMLALLFISTIFLGMNGIFQYVFYHFVLLIGIFLFFRTATLSFSSTQVALYLVIFSKRIHIFKVALNDTNKIAFIKPTDQNSLTYYYYPDSFHIIDTKHSSLLHSIPMRNFSGSITDIKDFCENHHISSMVLSDKDFYQDYYLPKNSAGKKAGYMGYSCILLVLLAIVFAFLDPYKTLDFGYVYYIVGVLTLFLALCAIKYSYIDKNYLQRQLPIFFIFVPCAYAMLFFLVLAVSPFLASTSQETFVGNKNKITKQNMVWQQKNGELELLCHYVKHKKSKVELAWTKQIKIYKTLTMTRIKINDACPR